jgi:hypothetical protein
VEARSPTAWIGDVVRSMALDWRERAIEAMDEPRFVRSWIELTGEALTSRGSLLGRRKSSLIGLSSLRPFIKVY